MIVGIRPEHFEDASLVADRSGGHTFKTTIDVLESLGSEHYAHFMVASEQVSSRELEELARDSGAAELGQARNGVQIVARLAAASRVMQGQEVELWFDTTQLHLFDQESGRSLLASNGARSIASTRSSSS